MELSHRKVFYLRDHPYITSAKGLGGCGKWPFLLMFSTVFMPIQWMGGPVDGSEKVQTYADVI